MVSQGKGVTAPEIAAKYGRELSTVQRQWKVADWWPEAIGKRGKWSLYDEAAVDEAIEKQFGRPQSAGGPEDLLTVAEIAAHTGLSPSTIRSDISRGRIPEADPNDADAGGVKRWRRRVVDEAMSGRRAYRRNS
ncbi:helix-turn-helix transcriptional regulator [Nocardia brasiliensis]|uniref:helix-turn-helix transcriptional regulator n=1 Tax=Nocardia brasiliensis TaxID=37326 RepID=UPI003408A27D